MNWFCHEIPIEQEAAVLAGKLGCASFALFFLIPLFFNDIPAVFGTVAGTAGIFCGVLALAFMLKRKTPGKLGVVFSIMLSLLSIYMINRTYYSANKPRESTLKMHCGDNLKQIGLALRNYAIDYEGNFPPFDGAAGLELLIKNDYLSDCKIYICPSSKLKESKRGTPLKEETISYVYTGGFHEKSTLPLVWEKDGNHKDFSNVLYCDGHVERLSGADWKEKLLLSKKQEQ